MRSDAGRFRNRLRGLRDQRLSPTTHSRLNADFPVLGD